MKITPPSATLIALAHAREQARAASTANRVTSQTSRTATPFASLVTDRRSATSATAAGAAEATTTPVATRAAGASAHSLVYSVPTAVVAGPAANTNAASTNTPAGSLPEAASPVAPAPVVATAASSTTATGTLTGAGSGGIAVPAQPGIAALITAIMNGSFQPVFLDASKLRLNPASVATSNSPTQFASDQTAQQLATLLGGQVVQQVTAASSDFESEPKANFIQLPGGQTVNAGDLCYYARFGYYGAGQLAADLTQEINQGGAISQYTQQMVAFMSGGGGEPPQVPSFQINEIGPAIAGMTYPPGTIAPDGSVINPMTQNSVGT